MNNINLRNKEMKKLYFEGYTLQEIGDKFGVTRERVRQIIGSQKHVIKQKSENSVKKILSNKKYLSMTTHEIVESLKKTLGEL